HRCARDRARRFVIDHPLAAGVLARPQLGWPGQPDRRAAPPDPLGGGADDDPDVADRISEPDGDLGDAQSERLNLVRSFAHRTDAHASDVGRSSELTRSAETAFIAVPERV